jgi:hypothetical protein
MNSYGGENYFEGAPNEKPATGRKESVDDSEPADLKTIPQNATELHGWIRRNLGVSLAREPLAPGHQAPFEYILHSFFGDELDGGAALASGAQRADAACHDVHDSVVWANRGGGKTFLGAIATALDLLFKPGIEVRILAGSLDQAARMHHHLRGFFSDPDLLERVQGRITDRRLILKNGSRLELLAQSQTSVRGTRVQKLRCDELDLFDEHVWEAAQLTTRSERCGHWRVRGTIECFSTMHRPHGLMSRLIEEAREGKRRLLRWNVMDVLETCPPERDCGSCALWPECQGKAKEKAPGHLSIDDAVRQKSRVSLAVWESEMLCLRARRTESVFPEFDVGSHVIHQEPDEAPACWLAGMDFGYRAPTVILWATLDGRGVLRIVDEHIVSQALLHEHIRALRESAYPRPAWIGIDPAGKQQNDQTGRSAAQVLSEAGFRWRARASRITAGLQAIRARLKPADGSLPRLLIHARCRQLIEAMEKYHYDASRPDKEEPVKDGPDHAVDALRYLIVNLDLAWEVRSENYLG